MEVVIIDSVTHEWDGKGGLLESNELLAQTAFKGNGWAAWSKTTPRHQKFIAAILASSCHVITTARSKTEIIQTEDKKIKKVGLKEIQREGWEYELTINFTLDREGHYATTSKDRTGMFIEGEPFTITQETGAKILEWAKQGVPPVPKEEPPVPLDSSKAQQETILRLAKDLQMDVQQDICAPAKLMWPLTAQQADVVIKGLEAKRTKLAKELDAQAEAEEQKAHEKPAAAPESALASPNAPVQPAPHQDTPAPAPSTFQTLFKKPGEDEKPDEVVQAEAEGDAEREAEAKANFEQSMADAERAGMQADSPTAA